MNDKKLYIVVVIIQAINASTFILAKAALDAGLGPAVFLFYRQAVASLLLVPFTIVAKWRNSPQLPFMVLLKIFMLALIGITMGLYVYNIGLKYTSETVSSAIFNAIPVITFFLAFLFRMETLTIRSSYGIAKAAGVALCLCGVMVVAFYAGPGISPLNHHHLFHRSIPHPPVHSKGMQILGTFLLLLSATAWSLWLIMQGLILNKECPSKLLLTTIQCLFSTFQSLIVALALAFERDFSKWKMGLDVRLLAVLFSGLVSAGISWHLQAWCLQNKGPVFVAMSNPLAIVFTIFCGLLILGETIHLGSIVGSILMVAGLYSVLWGKNKERKVLDSSNQESLYLTTSSELAAPTPHPFNCAPHLISSAVPEISISLLIIQQSKKQLYICLSGNPSPSSSSSYLWRIYTGLGPPVFLFYRQAVASLLLVSCTTVAKWGDSPQLPFTMLLKIFILAFIGITVGLNVCNIGLKYTSETVTGAISNSIPVITFFLAFLLRIETLKAKSSHGIAKAVGVVLCLCGAMAVAFYAGPVINPLSHHHYLLHPRSSPSPPVHSTGTQIKGTFLLLLSATTTSLWLIVQGLILNKECPSNLLFNTIQCVFSAIQSLVVALAFERDFSRWKLGFDVRLLGVLYTGLCSGGIQWYLLAWCLQKKGPVFVAMSNPLALAFTIFCALSILGEQIHLGSVLGGILMVGGLYSVLWGKHVESKASDSSTEKSEMEIVEQV
ncbi:hypothetical protein LUZ61_008105 [Rhynchospora tenuis]|uniref:EamA domain-containing protein n=1 Tax=Rhynchospora tenuis TaxID=198213 RepID=A0AAD5ZUP0_9POAL|nr:hypothetical protein LUZ61_008105 [Rhynchospora tenuis]